MVASQDVPRHLERRLSVHVLKGVLAKEEEEEENPQGSTAALT